MRVGELGLSHLPPCSLCQHTLIEHLLCSSPMVGTGNIREGRAMDLALSFLAAQEKRELSFTHQQ